MAERSILIAGAGIAGLTVALCFAAKGFPVLVLERAERLEEAGAGLQLSPNATRILARLGVLDHLRPVAVRPSSVCLKSAFTLATLARVPLDAQAKMRWGAPYLVAHRADLQQALLERVGNTPAIGLETGVMVKNARFVAGKVSVTTEKNAVTGEKDCDLLIGADGVWSSLRRMIGGGESRFTGYIAYRTTIKTSDIDPSTRKDLFTLDAVTAFLAPNFHLVAYPLRCGTEINLVAVTKGKEMAKRWANDADTAHLVSKAGRAAPALAGLVDKSAWTAWPIHGVTGGSRWVDPGGLALIGDAAHALPPYAAQGAAMAIEDAALLADLTVGLRDLRNALQMFERLRRPRVARVAQRGRFNHFVWHARGPIALARNIALKMRSEESLAADLDWLYGYDVEDEAVAQAALGGRPSEKA